MYARSFESRARPQASDFSCLPPHVELHIAAYRNTSSRTFFRRADFGCAATFLVILCRCGFILLQTYFFSSDQSEN